MIVQLDPKPFRESISHLAFTSPVTRHSRNISSSTPTKLESQYPSKRKKSDEDDSDELKPQCSVIRMENQASATDVTASRSLKKPKESDSPAKKKTRGYASPDVYAHLEALPDYIKNGLDVLFCGINPGCKSAKDGHHFAHPTNHFWSCLHLSGFTERRLHPSEDGILPDVYSLGLTNLVERPTSDASELSKEEMRAAAPRLLSRVVPLRPRILCFVGKDIWLHTKKTLLRSLAPLVATSPKKTRSEKDESNGRRSADKRQPNSMFAWDLQPYKLVYKAAEGRVSETLFFVVPSTSARVTKYQIKDKVEIFSRLHRRVEELRTMELDTSSMLTIHAETIGSSP